MSNHLSWPRFVAIVAWTCMAPSVVQAQDSDAAGILFSRGVNAFFADRSAEAEAQLSDAIALNSQDPRLYYFRSLSLLRQGRIAPARGDMQVGAALEAQQPNRFAIGKALERVQGSDRLMLERFRRAVPASNIGAAKVPARIQPFIEHDSAVLRESRVIPLDELLRPGGPRSIVAEPSITPPANPQSPDNPAAKPAAASPPKPKAASADPFQDDAESPATNPDVAPAEKSPAPETPEPAAPSSAPADDENPFGG